MAIISKIGDYNVLPRLDINSSISKIPFLTSSDADLHVPSDINLNYYTTHDFQNSHDIKECFIDTTPISILHCNIRSLSANFDNLLTMLSQLYFPFSIIGLTETKLKTDHDASLNIDLVGYQLVSIPSNTNAGGVGFYIKDNVKFRLRSDLTMLRDEFEALWIEIQNDFQQNMLCGVIYRHPSGKSDSFTDYINTVTGRINQENKCCAIMGDFNIDLLKIETHVTSDECLNNLVSSFFQPHILQPTRVTDHSATLIDNIFLTLWNIIQLVEI